MSAEEVYSIFKTECEKVISILNEDTIDNDQLSLTIKQIKWPVKNGRNNDLFIVGVLVNDIKSAHKIHNIEILYTVTQSSLDIINYIINRDNKSDDDIKSVAKAYTKLKECWKKIYDVRYYFDLCALKIPQLICNNIKTADTCYKYIQYYQSKI